MSIITIQVGQCGNQLGFELFKTLCQDIEGGDKNGCHDQNYYSACTERFFASDCENGLVASAVLVDTEQKVVSKVLLEACRSNKWHYPKDGSFTLKQGAGNNWAAGYLEHAEEGLGHISDLIRQRAEKCDWIDGFFPILSLAGGTGSGLGTRITESLRDDYPHTSLVNAVVWPFNSGEVAVQAYNAVLSLSHLQGASDALVVLGNDDLHHVASRRWALKNASLPELNAVGAQQIACLLQPSRTSDGLSTRIGDVPVSLGSHGHLRLGTLLQVPQESPQAASFSCTAWMGLVRSLHKMRLCQSSIDEGMGTEGSPLRNVATLTVARGEDLSSLHLGPLVPMDSVPFVPTSDRLTSWSCRRRFLGRGKTLLLADNGQSCLSLLEPLVSQAWGRFTEGAYLHHYARHGLQAEDLADAFIHVEQTLEAYRQLSHS